MITRKFIVIGVGIVLVIILGIGGKVYMDNKRFNDEMVNVVKSGQAKREIEIGLKNLDSKALTPEGIIKSYEIDYESIEHNPMGGIMFDVIINDDEKLRVYNLLNKNTEDGTLENSGGGNTAELEELLKKGKN
ncbi:DUF1310 family protein [Enterococcus caccae]|uniref:DUF1310 family protein n=1 Tax=Enterococcus caccae ATCC BAA-1240 TaxID=1158612 RepID=R3WXE7_9ENTE|nr:DUF1310 family protein [Enterococcus caccae]EOL46440.1 hypothetical protein UC7_01407 [Enterococcus caccae ATCC BAA-1240]EOT60809.1 hypothetical protein I580_01709 [Enterococcus caccae ATCC BAA-1240]